MEHPMISQINKNGYPENLREQPEHYGIDFFGDEVLEGDDVVEYDGELILKDNLERFLSEELGFVFKAAD